MKGFLKGRKLHKMGLKAQERLLVADLGISVSEFTFEEMRNYVKQRKLLGKQLCIYRAYEDAPAQPMYGTNEIMKELIAREIVRDK
ncbi:hypothetical protein HPG69_018000 [Diceros bicornis minor]|uniref:Uncharacterized protein n=1 Tax=Diceros bicornis minor TaxID=77932 RepID=A0A7J7F4M0_DICBM|nr:hypothetical protein HPG69_018000 [Diceros bicornis minor]